MDEQNDIHNEEEIEKPDSAIEDTGAEDIDVEDMPEMPDDDDVAPDDDLDIDAALASVASLDDAISEHEAEEAEEEARIAAEALVIEQAQQAVREEAERRDAYFLPRPPMMIIQRGQAASTVPALLLIIIGSWLTFSFTTSDTPPSGATIALVALAGVGVSLLAYWWTSGRWAIGALFGGTVLLLLCASMIYLSQSDGMGHEGWPLIIVAVGVALLLGVILSSPVGKHHTFSGVLLVMSGLLALAITTGKLGEEIFDLPAELALLVLIVVFVFVMLPPILKRRG